MTDEQEKDPTIFSSFLTKTPVSDGQLRRTELRAVRKSTAVTLLIVALLAGAGWLLLWPSQQRQAQQIAAVQQQVAAVPEQINPLRQELQTLAKSVAALKAQGQNLVETGDRPLAGAALALAQFRQAASNGAPFAPALQLLQKTVGADDPALADMLAKLAPAANTGVPTTQSLSAQFPAIAQSILAASAQNPGGSLAERAKTSLNNIVEVHKDGALVSGTATQGQVDAAQSALATGNIAGAVESLRHLSGPELTAAEPWLHQAELTMIAQRVGDAIGTKISAALVTPVVKP